MSTRQTRINQLQEATASGSPLEHLLLHEAIVHCDLHGTAHPGSSDVYKVVFASRLEAYFKPFTGQNVASCQLYSQDPLDVPLNEVVAWRLAHALGPPYDQLGTTAVLRDIPDAGGAGVLMNARAGLPSPAVFTEIPKQIDDAAFWDSLVAQQDRHANNFRYDAVKKRLGLIDHGYSFACPGNKMHGAVFLRNRRQEHRSKITDDEHEVLQRIIDKDFFGITTFLPDDRAEAFTNRVHVMASAHTLPLPGAF